MNLGTNWGFAALGDGLARTFSSFLQKTAGLSMLSWHSALISNAVIELVRALTGYSTSIASGQKLQVSKKQLILIGLIAFNATCMTVLHLVSYNLDADQGVATLILLCSIVPRALIDKLLLERCLRIGLDQNVFNIIFTNYWILGKQY